MRRRILKKSILYYILIFVEAAVLYPLIFLLRLMPITMASGVAGWFSGKIIPFMREGKKSLANIGFAMPETDMAERHRINRESWVNLGRNFGEFVHFDSLIKSDRFEIEGLHHIENNTKGGFAISGHIGNWEIAMLPIFRSGKTINMVFRPANNFLMSPLLKLRLKIYNESYVKGLNAARGMKKTIREKGYFALLADQKLRQGMAVNFFGHEANTPVSHIKIALKERVPIFMLRVIRVDKCRFRICISELPMPELHNSNGRDNEAIAAIATRMNAIFETWIREHPEQWVWGHRRWDIPKTP